MKQRHQKMKDSGVEWLGEMPSHWNITRVKRVGSIRYGLGEPPEYATDGLPFVRATDINAGKIDLSSVKRVDPKNIPWSRRPGLELNEILVVRSGAYTGDSAIVTKAVAGLIAGFDMVLTVKNAGPRFVAWALLSKYMLEGQIHLERMRAAQPHLNAEELGNFVLLLPPIPEQLAIADFLDRKTAEIDALVLKKRALIEKLKEKSSALISRTVTRGLPPEVARAAGLEPHPKLKHTEIDWIGPIPEHWEVKSVSRVAESIQTGPFGSQLHESDFIDGGIPLINPAHIVGGSVVPDEHSSVDQPTAERLGRHRLKAGDIIVGRRGEIGRCAVITEQEEGWLCGTGSLRIRLHNVEPRYLSRIIASAGFSGLLELNAVGTTMLNLNPTIVGRMQIPVPPMPEQLAIADFLDHETATVDSLVAKVEQAIERLQEYRTAVVTAAVTGKIDVSNARDVGRTEIQTAASGARQ